MIQFRVMIHLPKDSHVSGYVFSGFQLASDVCETWWENDPIRCPTDSFLTLQAINGNQVLREAIFHNDEESKEVLAKWRKWMVFV